MWEKTRDDYGAYCAHLDISGKNFVAKWCHLAFRSTFVVVLLFRLSNSRIIPIKVASVVAYKCARIISGIQIPRGTDIGGGLLIPHYGCLVVNRNAKIGNRCVLLHNVTIGAKGRGDDSGVPEIGSNVYVGAGASILGTVRVGDGAVIGANCVVVKDIPASMVAVGNPAKVTAPIRRH